MREQLRLRDVNKRDARRREPCRSDRNRTPGHSESRSPCPHQARRKKIAHAPSRDSERLSAHTLELNFSIRAIQVQHAPPLPTLGSPRPTNGTAICDAKKTIGPVNPASNAAYEQRCARHIAPSARVGQRMQRCVCDSLVHLQNGMSISSNLLKCNTTISTSCVLIAVLFACSEPFLNMPPAMLGAVSKRPFQKTRICEV